MDGVEPFRREVRDRHADETDDAVHCAKARATLRIALSSLLRLFAPFLPYVTEEVWSWWRAGSIHRAPWPSVPELGVTGNPLVYAVAAEVLGAVRKEKSEQGVSLAWPVDRVVVGDTTERLAALDAARSDVCDAGKIAQLSTEVDGQMLVKVELAAPTGP